MLQPLERNEVVGAVRLFVGDDLCLTGQVVHEERSRVLLAVENDERRNVVAFPIHGLGNSDGFSIRRRWGRADSVGI